DIAQPAVLARPELRGGREATEGNLAQALAAQTGDDDGLTGDGHAARARLARLPLLHRVGELVRLVPARAVLARAALDLGPAVVAAGLDHVELVPSVLAELRSVHRALLVPGDALRVPVAHAEDQRIVERVVLGNLAIGAHAQDLPGQRLPVLRAVAIAGVAEGGVEHPIGPERQTSPIVEAAGGQAVE